MAQTLTEIRSALEAGGLRPKKMFGQNFLIDHNLLAAMVALADVQAGECVLEVGPGTGALTDFLLAAGARVLAVEIDRGLSELLRGRYAGVERFELFEGDILAGKHRLNPDVLARLREFTAKPLSAWHGRDARNEDHEETTSSQHGRDVHDTESTGLEHGRDAHDTESGGLEHGRDAHDTESTGLEHGRDAHDTESTRLAHERDAHDTKTPARVKLVSNLPYNIATSLVVECLVESLAANRDRADAVRFDSLTVTVQREVARRLSAEAGSDDYGPASVMVGLLGRATRGKLVPPEAFWPRPNVTSQMLRIDASDPGREVLDDAEQLGKVLQLTFTQRRKTMAAVARRKDSPIPADVFAAALERSGIDPNARPEVLAPKDFATLARAIAAR